MSKRIVFTDDQIKEIIRLYEEENWTPTKIGEKFGCSAGAILRVLKEKGVELRIKGELKKYNFTKEQIKEMIKLYRVEEYPLDPIAEQFDCDRSVIKRKLEENNVKFRTHSEAKRKHKNEDVWKMSAKDVWKNSRKGKGYSDGNISFENFLPLSQKECFYCGQTRVNCRNQLYKADHRYELGAFYYNGLDRLDNNRLHDKDNVVTSCGPCNTGRMGRPIEEYIQHQSNAFIINLETLFNDPKVQLLSDQKDRLLEANKRQTDNKIRKVKRMLKKYYERIASEIEKIA